MLIYLCVVHGCFPVTEAEISSSKEILKACKPKMLLSVTLRKSLLTIVLDHPTTSKLSGDLTHPTGL